MELIGTRPARASVLALEIVAYCALSASGDVAGGCAVMDPGRP